jgi:phage terminase large subunit-like protein
VRKGQGHFADVAIRYAEQVVAGEILVGQQIRSSCAGFLHDIQGDTWVFSANHVERVCAFAQTFPYLEGELAQQGKTLTLEPWQIWILAALFGLLGQDGLRKHREAFLLIPRKNGKSTLAAAIALYMLVADNEPRAQVFIGANSKQQADYCFQPCRDMATRARGFTRHWGASVTVSKIVLQDGSYLERTIRKPGDGGNPHCAILDEAHENDSADQRLTMTTGMGARRQPLLVTITTAGTNTAGPCRDLQLYSEQILAGELEQPRHFSAIYTIDKGDNWQDFAVWLKANPNAGVSVPVETIRGYHKTALDKPSERVNLLTKHLNIWQSSSEAWVNMREWDDNMTAPPLADLEPGLPAWIGCDLSKLLDTTAIVLLVQRGDELLAYPFIFLPEMAVDRSAKNASAYREWADKGHLILTPDEETDFGAVEAKLIELSARFNVQGIAMDQWQAAMMSQRLAQQGLSVLTYPQNYQNMHPAMTRFEKQLALGKLKVANNPMFRWMAGNVCAGHYGEFIKPVKPARRDHAKIDAFVSLMMALGLATKEVAAPREVWMEMLD